jgi:hypothetical protein
MSRYSQFLVVDGECDPDLRKQGGERQRGMAQPALARNGLPVDAVSSGDTCIGQPITGRIVRMFEREPRDQLFERSPERADPVVAEF